MIRTFLWLFASVHRWGISPSDIDASLGNECFKHWRLDGESLLTKTLDMEPDCGLHISEHFFVGVALADNDPLHTKWICHITVRVLFDDDLDLPHDWLLLSKRGIDLDHGSHPVAIPFGPAR